MNYLNHATLKVFLYLLYSKNSILLINFRYLERQNIIDDIFSNKIEDLFEFKNSITVINNPTLEDISGCLFDISAGIKTLEIILKDSNKRKLLNFIHSYINGFKNNTLLSNDSNYYPYEKSYKLSVDLLEKYKEFGKKINIKIPFNDKSIDEFYKKEVRFLEVIFYLMLNRYIEINKINIDRTLFELDNDNFTERFFFIISVKFNKTLDEIAALEQTSISYGDLKLNLIDHIVFYKDNHYKFKSADSKSYKLLKLLIENSGRPVLIEDVYLKFNIEYRVDRFKDKKEIIINAIKDIKKKLKMSQDKEASIKISVSGKEILLKPNTP